MKWITGLKIYLVNYPSYSDLLIAAEIRDSCGVEDYLKAGFCYFNATDDIRVF
jgi:hypothetical protein